MSEERERRAPLLMNRLPAEGINSSEEHPLKEFAWLVGASLALLALLVALLAWGARWLAPQVPFSAEVALAERIVDRPTDPDQVARTAALQILANRVAAQMKLPAGMNVVMSSDGSSLINAYATIGGRIRVFDGLLCRLESEDALAALLAHETAHVRHRHVAANLARGMAAALVLSIVSADAGAAAARSALGQAASWALLGYSREQEAQADEEALNAVVKLYGHAGGMVELFERLGTASADREPHWTILSSHPLTSDRLAAALAQARQAGWSTAGTRTPMPAQVRPLRGCRLAVDPRLR